MMRAIGWHGTGDIRLDTVDDPKVEEPTAIEAYRRFDRREEGWLKTVLDVS
jgi:threonine dehydrogenase-like Zn-dependent dehydrogenase